MPKPNNLIKTDVKNIYKFYENGKYYYAYRLLNKSNPKIDTLIQYDNERKAKLSYSTATTYKNNTLKAVVTLGTTAITYGLSLITKYFYTSRASCYYSIDLGLRISHWTPATATVVVAGVCVAAPYIAPAVGKIYTSVLSSISSYKAFIRALTAIASAGMTVATKLA